MTFINLSIALLSAGMLLNAYMIIRLSRALSSLWRQQKADIEFVHELFDNHLKTHQSIGEHQAALLRLLKDLNQPETNE